VIRIIRNEDRYHYESDWLSTYWHFSFDHYYDASNVGFGALRVFNDDRIRPASGFPMHSHREMEIITYVLEGELEHRDSTGGAGRISAGEVQRMSAGFGIKHSERNPSTEAEVHLLQMWITPGVRNLQPSYEQKQFTTADRTGKLLALASGQGVPGAVKIHQDVTLYASALWPRDEVSLKLGPERKAYLFVIEGEVTANDRSIGSGDQARVEAEPVLRLVASKDSEIVLIDLP
jgi:redox-sensitive bicupin YhaK (pirin superfamily)